MDTDERCQTLGLTRHQRTILGALRALTEAHGNRWWSRDAIGQIVCAGGFHQTIQTRSMIVLKQLGLVQTEDSAWPDEIRNMVRCTCACHEWGLTEAGETRANRMEIRWSAEIGEKIAQAFPGWSADRRHDEGEESYDADA